MTQEQKYLESEKLVINPKTLKRLERIRAKVREQIKNGPESEFLLRRV